MKIGTIVIAAGALLMAASVALAATVVGTDGPDTLAGTNQADEIYGKAGNDTLRGKDANDLLRGGTERDTLCGESGDDNLSGNEGADWIIDGYVNGPSDCQSSVPGDVDTVDGGGGNDSVTVYDEDALDTVDCGAGADDGVTADVGDIVTNCERVYRDTAL